MQVLSTHAYCTRKEDGEGANDEIRSGDNTEDSHACECVFMQLHAARLRHCVQRRRDAAFDVQPSVRLSSRSITSLHVRRT